MIKTLLTTPDPRQEWMDIESLSNYIGYSKSYIYKMTCRRKLPFYRPGKKVFFKQSEIDSWIQSSRYETLNEKTTNTQTLKTQKP